MDSLDEFIENAWNDAERLKNSRPDVAMTIYTSRSFAKALNAEFKRLHERLDQIEAKKEDL